MNKLKLFLVYGTLFILVLLRSVQSSAEGVGFQLPLPPFFTQNIPSSIDVRDLQRHTNDPYQFYKELNRYLTKHSEEIFGNKVSFSEAGVGKGNLKDTVFSVVFFSEAVNMLESIVLLRAQALVNSSTDGVYIRTFDVYVEGFTGRILQVLALPADVRVFDTQWNMLVSLVERKAILTEATTGFKVIYPVGVGGFNEIYGDDRVELLTPTFDSAKLPTNFAVNARTVPDYFMGKPFLRIAYSDDGYTLYAFHAVPGGGKFIRGFESHGCMRLRDKDLYELLLLIRNSKDHAVNLTVKQSFLPDEAPADHPYPLETKRYNRVKNFGSATHPKIKHDEMGLTITEIIYKAPPIEKLKPQGVGVLTP